MDDNMYIAYVPLILIIVVAVILFLGGCWSRHHVWTNKSNYQPPIRKSGIDKEGKPNK